MELLEKIEKNITITKGCWKWNLYKDKLGLPIIWANGKSVPAHRFVYEMFNGEIQYQQEIKQTCKNKGCINPEHLIQVTRAENVKDTGVGRHNKIKTHCPKGHPYDKKNTLRIRDNYRQCIICKRAFGRKYAAKRRANEKL
tara:strand:+ start:296 stop:718 length:423 start_codon:yes stop_codon:yes gene_type:complete